MSGDLIKRLEKAVTPDRELDGLIWKVADPDAWTRNCTFRGKMYAGHIHTKAEKTKHEKRSGAYYSPKFTASIDAALTLVPQGWKAILYTETRVAELYPAEGVKRPAGIQARAGGCATLPIALCIAALNARKP